MIKKALREFLNFSPKKEKKIQRTRESFAKKNIKQFPKIKIKKFPKINIKTFPVPKISKKQKAVLKKYEEPSVVVDTQKTWDSVIPEEKLIDVVVPDRVKRLPRTENVSKKIRHLMFTNPGEAKVEELYSHFRTGSERPLWSLMFDFVWNAPHVKLEDLVLRRDKQKLVRETYFNSREPSTIEAMWYFFIKKYCNVSKRNIRDCLNKIEMYQIHKKRFHPKPVKGVFNITKQGYVTFDLFFTSNKWDTKYPVLSQMDIWSRYVRITALANKTKKLVHSEIQSFLQELLSRGVKLRAMLHDKGSEFLGLDPMAKKFNMRNITSPTGRPILSIEALNSQIERRLEPFMSSGVCDDVSMLVKNVQYQLNHRQPIRNKQNKLPIQLISMSENEVAGLLVKRRDPVFHNDSLPAMKIGDWCRYLVWSRKTQESPAMHKGYEEKYSRTKHQITSVRKSNKDSRIFRYKISGINVSFWRHEIIKIPSETDTIVPRIENLEENVLDPFQPVK